MPDKFRVRQRISIINEIYDLTPNALASDTWATLLYRRIGEPCLRLPWQLTIGRNKPISTERTDYREAMAYAAGRHFARQRNEHPVATLAECGGPDRSPTGRPGGQMKLLVTVNESGYIATTDKGCATVFNPEMMPLTLRGLAEELEMAGINPVLAPGTALILEERP